MRRRYLLILGTTLAMALIATIKAKAPSKQNPPSAQRIPYVCSAKEPSDLHMKVDKMAHDDRLGSQLLSLRASAPIQTQTALDVMLQNLQQGLLVGYRWPAGTTLRIAFLSGDPAVQQRVQASAEKWLPYANIKFTFTTNVQSAVIRIGIDSNGRSESQVGTQALTTPSGQETMHFGWLTDASSQADYDAVVLHEFGHVLGLVHEHQLPNATIQWNTEYVYNYCLSQWGWSRNDVDHNIFEKYEPAELIFSRMDPASVMMYSFPKEWTTNSVSTPWNYALSPADEAFAKQMYPPSN